MRDADTDYVDAASDDEQDHMVSSSGRGGGAGGSGGGERGGMNTRRRAAARDGGRKERWEDIHRSWDTVVEGADGSIEATITEIREKSKRKRMLRDTTPLQRGIIRHLILVLDMSLAMTEKDMRPTRHRLVCKLAQEFVAEFFDQNPISQLGVLAMRDGICSPISDVSGNPNEHISAIETWKDRDPRGNPSLQNSLEMARGLLFHAPTHGTREVLIVFGALLSSDPGDIHSTLKSLIADRIRVSIVGLAAEVAICRELCYKTNGNSNGAYTVALDGIHLRELIMSLTTPPASLDPARAKLRDTDPALLMCGFPSHSVERKPSLCACHSRLTHAGYRCSRCKAKVCTLPIDCPTCNLTLILSTHLARSYHHLFPLLNWVEVTWDQAKARLASLQTKAEKAQFACCFGCMRPFPQIPKAILAGHTEQPDAPAMANGNSNGNVKGEEGDETTEKKLLDQLANATTGASPSSRYECTVCHSHFCVDCDVWSHEHVHNCPGCQSLELAIEQSDAMEIDGT